MVKDKMFSQSTNTLLLSLTITVVGGVLNGICIIANNGKMSINIADLSNISRGMDTYRLVYISFGRLGFLGDFLTIGSTMWSIGDIIMVWGWVVLLVGLIQWVLACGKKEDK